MLMRDTCGVRPVNHLGRLGPREAAERLVSAAEQEHGRAPDVIGASSYVWRIKRTAA